MPKEKEREIKELQTKPRHIGEWAKRSQVKPKYMVMGFWTPRYMRKGRSGQNIT